MAVRSPTMRPTPSWPSSRTARGPGTRSGPTSSCLPSSPIWGRRTIKEDVMNRLEKVLYTAKVHGWSACFESAMEFAARNMKIMLPADHAVDAEIDLGPEGGAFSLAARLYVSLPGMELATAPRLVEAAHQACPYSRATHRTIAVGTTLV